MAIDNRFDGLDRCDGSDGLAELDGSDGWNTWNRGGRTSTASALLPMLRCKLLLAVPTTTPRDVFSRSSGGGVTSKERSLSAHGNLRASRSMLHETTCDRTSSLQAQRLRGKSGKLKQKAGSPPCLEKEKAQGCRSSNKDRQSVMRRTTTERTRILACFKPLHALEAELCHERWVCKAGTRVPAVACGLPSQAHASAASSFSPRTSANEFGVCETATPAGEARAQGEHERSSHSKLEFRLIKWN